MSIQGGVQEGCQALLHTRYLAGHPDLKDASPRMLERLREWLSPTTAEDETDSGWGLSLWWGAVIVALFTVAISLCNEPAGEEAVAAPPATTQPPQIPTTTLTPIGTPNLLELIEGRSELSFFRSLIAVGGIDEAIATGGPFTFFAPTNDAFTDLDDALRDQLLADPNTAINFLGAHVVVGPLTAAEIAAAGVVDTGSGETLPVEAVGDTVRIGGMTVIDPDLVASNGIVHVVDRVRAPNQPPEPPDDPGSVPVSQVIAEREDLSTLAAALNAADDESLLQGDEAGFTVFAPTNDAFTALPAGSVEVLLQTQPKLIELLGYHVVAGRLLAADLSDGQVLTTASGAELPVSVDGAIVRVGDTLITEADIVSADGVIHIVEGVLLPPDYSLPTINEALNLDPITFETSSATITPAGIEVLQTAVDFLTANADVRVAIEGHTDSQGGEAANQALSEARAESVRDYLVEQGIDPERLETAGFGETRPIADNGTAEGRAQNRRIEFRLL